MSIQDDDVWALGWLDHNYGGAPDECSTCYREGRLVKFDDCSEH